MCDFHPADGSWGGTWATAAVLHLARPYWSGGGRGKYAVESEVPGREGGSHLCWFPPNDAHLEWCPFCTRGVDGVTHYLADHNGLVDEDGLELKFEFLVRDNSDLYCSRSLSQYDRLVAGIREVRRKMEEELGGAVVWPNLPAYEPEVEGKECQKPHHHLDVLMKYVPLPERGTVREDWLWEMVQQTGLSRRQVRAWCHPQVCPCVITCKSFLPYSIYQDLPAIRTTMSVFWDGEA